MKPLHRNTIDAIKRMHAEGYAAAAIARRYGLLVPEVKKLTRKPRKSRAGQRSTSRRELESLRPPGMSDEEFAAVVAANIG